MTSATFGERVAAAREGHGLSQSALARTISVSRSAINQWERGASIPSISMIERIADKLNVCPSWLAFGAQSATTPERQSYDPNAPATISQIAYTSHSVEPTRVANWSFPREWITREFDVPDQHLAIINVPSDSSLGLSSGDMVVINRDDVRPSPAGLFLYWDGIGPNFAFMQSIPGHQDPTIRLVTIIGDHIDISLADLKIIGRAIGKWSRIATF